MRELSHLIILYGPLAVFLAVFLDEAGLPIPSLPLLVVAGGVLWADHSAFAAVIAAALAATLLADLLWYGAARAQGGRVLAILCRVSLSPDSCVRRTENLFSKIGPSSFLFARYVPPLNNLAVAMAGILKLSLPVFVLLNLAGGFLFYGAAALLGALFHRAVDDILSIMTTFGTVSIAAVVTAFALYILFRWWERFTFTRQLRMDRITVEELIGLLDSGRAPLILDVRSAEIQLRDGVIPGSLPAHPDDIHSRLKEIPTDVEIVVYCACPNEASAATAARHLKRAGFKKIRPLLGGVDAWVAAKRALAQP
jgi:membrane protein DedA with SNARE-associated domain/rhodanese-related sulfurtransferase